MPRSWTCLRGSADRGLYTIVGTWFCMLSCISGLPTIRIVAGGATLPLDVYKVWRPVYAASRSKFANIDLSYYGVGSGEGIKRLENKEYDYAGSDAVITDEIYHNFTDFQMFPCMAVPVAIAYNIPELPTGCDDDTLGMHRCLNLTQAAIVGIFNGTISFWDDPLIVMNNDVLRVVHQKILVVVRADSSGTTELLTRALSEFDSDWRQQYSYFTAGCDHDGIPLKWNPHLNARCANQGHGVSGVVLDAKYSLAYMGPTDARDSNLPAARIQNREGTFVSPDVANVQAAMDVTSSNMGPRLTGSLVNALGIASYPISGYTYIVIRKTQMLNCTVAMELYRMFGYLLEDPLAASIMVDLLKAPLTATVLDQVKWHAFGEMRCMEKNVKDLVELAISIEDGTHDAWKLPVIVTLAILGIIITGLAAVFYYAKYQQNKGALRNTFIIPSVTLEGGLKSTTSMRTLSTGSAASSAVSKSIIWYSPRFDSVVVKQGLGDNLLLTGLCPHLFPNSLRWPCRVAMIKTRDLVGHPSVMRFLGLCLYEEQWKIVCSYPSKGCLRKVLKSKRFTIDNVFRFSIINDIAQGMWHLHKHGYIHGQLTSHSCFVDAHWTVVVGDWEQYSLHQAQGVEFRAFEKPYLTARDGDNRRITQYDEYHTFLMWSAPEVLTRTQVGVIVVTAPRRPADVYSYGVIAFETFTDMEPYEGVLHSMDKKHSRSPIQILGDIKEHGQRPASYNELAMKYDVVAGLISSTWERKPEERPTFSQIIKSIKKANPSQQSILDSMMVAVEIYAQSLEEKVQERTRELERTSKSLETLLNSMLPPSLAGKLARGEAIEPEFYDGCTIFFSDVVGFTTIAASNSPLDVIKLLNDLYSAFDGVIGRFDVYKVETIGDAYMCVSGVPEKNADRHAKEIAVMALDILHLVMTVRISDVITELLRIRVGLNSGPVMAGVVGLKMPRYCLFGDTVNTASRMESSSLPMRIQAAEPTKLMLDVHGSFQFVSRGTRNVKGKGLMTTYWLIGMNGYEKELPGFNPADDEKLLAVLDESQIK